MAVDSARPGKLAVLKFFAFKGKILGSAVDLADGAKLEAAFPGRGAQLLNDLVSYHPEGNIELEMQVFNADTPDTAFLRATAFGTGWAEDARTLFKNISFIPSPTGYKFLVAKQLDPAIHHIKEWTLHYAKLEGGPNPYLPEDVPPPPIAADDPRARKVVLVWSLKGFDEYVYTCWKWG